MIKWIKKHFHLQFTKYDITPEAKYSEREQKFYLNCNAGLISYKPRNLKELTSFRDKWVNKFEVIKREEKKDSWKFFILYSEIRSKVKRVEYKANLRARWAVFLCNLFL